MPGAAGAYGALPAGGRDDTMGPPVESPWATTSARFERPVLPSSYTPELDGPEKPVAPPAQPAQANVERSSKTTLLVLGVILAVAILTLVATSIWQSTRSRAPISVEYNEPPASQGVEAPAPAPSETAAPGERGERAAPRPKPAKNDDFYDAIERENRKR